MPRAGAPGQRIQVASARQPGMKLLEPGRLLVGASKGTDLRLLIMRAQEGEADRSARPANLIVIAGIDSGWSRGVGVAQAVGHDHRRMAGQICNYQLLAV